MPKNSLKGAATFCLLISLLEKFKNREFVVSNFDLKNFSAKKLLIILIPLIVSSVIDVNSACSLWTNNDFLFKVFPINEIIKPEIGMNKITNIVSL